MTERVAWPLDDPPRKPSERERRGEAVGVDRDAEHLGARIASTLEPTQVTAIA